MIGSLIAATGKGSDAIYAGIVLVLVVVIAVGAWLDD